MIEDQYLYAGACADYFSHNRFDEKEKIKHTITVPSEVTCVKEAFAGEEIVLKVTLAKTKKLNDIVIKFNDKTKSVLKDMKFTMPDADVKIETEISTVSTKTNTKSVE